MYGGAVGGGKTEALLLWLAEGVQIPNFSGLFLRRTFTQLQGSPTAPIERSFKFFKPLGGHYIGSKRVWQFPNGAMVRFGHMQYENDKHNYDGPEFHRVAFDQVEQFTETQYTYMFSRIRRTVDFPLSCGVRSSANPIGGTWVKRRFVTDAAIDRLKGFTAHDPSPIGMMFLADCGAVFVPSRIADNPTLAVDEYIERLRTKLGAALAARLANGDWSVVEGAIIDPEDLRYYTMQGEIIIPLDGNGDRLQAANHPNGLVISRHEVERFATIDTAGTSKQKAREDKGANHSWSVCGNWDHFDPAQFLFLRHIWRRRVEYSDLKKGISDTLTNWQVPLALIENAHHGPPLASDLSGHHTVRLVNTVLSGMKDCGVPKESAKHERAIAGGLITMIDEHRFYLPDVATVPGAAAWMPEFESELLTWTGRPDETADQVDICSYAADHVKSGGMVWGGAI